MIKGNKHAIKGKLLLKKIIQDPASFFLLLGAPIGLFFLIAIPPFQAPDEQAHFFKAYSISKLNIVQDNIGRENSGAYLPRALVEYQRVVMRGNLAYDDKAKYTVDTVRDSFDIKIDEKDTVGAGFVNLATYSPVAYIPQAIGIGLANLFTDRVAVIFYAARVFSLLFYIIAIYLILKISKIGSWVFALIALSPMTLFLASVLSADSVLIVATLLMVVCVTNIFRKGGNNKITGRQWFYLTLLGLALTLSKQAYITLLPLMFVLSIYLTNSHGHFRLRDVRINWRNFGIVLSMITICFVTFCGWMYVTKDVFSDISIARRNSGLTVDPEQQKDFILSHPTGAATALFRTIFTQESDGIFKSAVGVFGPLNVHPPLFALMSVVLSVLLMAGYTCTRNRALNTKKRAIYSLVAYPLTFMIFIIILMGLYVTWTPVASRIIEGFQGRYLLPLIITLVPAFVGVYKNNLRLRSILAIFLIGYVPIVYTIVARYYFAI